MAKVFYNIYSVKVPKYDKSDLINNALYAEQQHRE